MSVGVNRIFTHFSRNIEEPLRQHLKNVYGCLTLSGVSAIAGAYAHIYTMFSLGVFLSGLAGLGLIIALKSTPYNGKNIILKMSYLLGASFFIGMGMGPLVQYAMKINPSLNLTALLGTTLVFACFTLSVLFAKRGYWLLIFGPLSTLGSLVLFLSLGNILFGSYWIYQINLYLGLLMMCGFVLFDTTLIMEKFRMGDKDFISHALDLFVDFISIFKHVLILMTEKEREGRDRRRN